MAALDLDGPVGERLRLAGARADDARRTGREGAATGYGILAVVALLIFLGGVVLGVQVMLSK